MIVNFKGVVKVTALDFDDTLKIDDYPNADTCSGHGTCFGNAQDLSFVYPPSFLPLRGRERLMIISSSSRPIFPATLPCPLPTRFDNLNRSPILPFRTQFSMASKEVEMKPVGFGELNDEMDIEAGNKPQVFDRRYAL